MRITSTIEPIMKEPIIRSYTIKTNKRKGTATVGKYINGKLHCKYKIFDLSKEEIDAMENFTHDDMTYYLQHNFNYYEIQ